MITHKRQIMSIVKITNMELIDHHKPNKKSPYRDVIFIALADGDIKKLDMFAEMDVTNIDYWEYKKTWKSKEKVLFKHWNINDVAEEEQE